MCKGKSFLKKTHNHSKRSYNKLTPQHYIHPYPKSQRETTIVHTRTQSSDALNMISFTGQLPLQLGSVTVSATITSSPSSRRSDGSTIIITSPWWLNYHHHIAVMAQLSSSRRSDGSTIIITLQWWLNYHHHVAVMAQLSSPCSPSSRSSDGLPAIAMQLSITCFILSIQLLAWGHKVFVLSSSHHTRDIMILHYDSYAKSPHCLEVSVFRLANKHSSHYTPSI